MQTIKHFLRTAMVILSVILISNKNGISQPTIVNGETWYDTAGNTIEAHGPGFLKVGETYYWFGEDKSHNAGPFKAVNCYSSTDLIHWEFRNAVVTGATHPDIGNYIGNRIIERPKVIYNSKTGKFVMWAHWDWKNYGEAEAVVFQCDRVDGNYELVKHFRPFGNMSRDCNLYQSDDGLAYFYSAANNNADMILYKLTDDYLDVKEQVATLWSGAYREAPVIFKRQNLFYFLTSGATGWAPNQAKYATSSSVEGPWSGLTNFGDKITFDSQPTYVLEMEGSEDTTYIYCGDRWQDPDLKSSKYIWLPLEFTSDGPNLKYVHRWSIDIKKGTWNEIKDSILSQEKWQLIMADSEELEGSDTKAIYAFDGNSTTIWHTQWYKNSPEFPHEIQIDLGDTAKIYGFTYQPRQDGSSNGTISEYRFYAGMDKNNWGDPVATGTFSASVSEKFIDFGDTVNCRYIRLVALSEVNGKNFASVAELNVLGNYILKGSNFPTGLYNFPNHSGFKVFPNPFQNSINIKIEIKEEYKQWRISSMDGRLMKEGWIPFSNNNMRINTGDLKSGIYLMELTGLDKKVIKMIVKK